MSEQPGSYDLFTRKAGWTAQAVLIVSPYVEREFFDTVIRALRPKRMYVVIDDGCRREDSQTVHDAVRACGLRRAPRLICKLGSARGLVHMKLFYVLWTTPGGQAAHSLVFGSANATRQGFSGFDNAELVASTRLTAAQHGDVIGWCSAAIAATEGAGTVHVPSVTSAKLARGMHLRLPAINIGRQVEAVSNFDLWIQRGWLLSDFRGDPGFVHIPIQLSKSLPAAELAQMAEGAGFAIRQTKRLRYRYVAAPVGFEEDDDEEPAEPDDPDIGNWRRKLFVWTNLGDWCSDACYEAHERRFRRRGHDDRVRALEQLDALRTPAHHTAARDKFLADLAVLWNRFGAAAPTLLRGKKVLDDDLYGVLFDQRVERDLALAKDCEFRKRFTRGSNSSRCPVSGMTWPGGEVSWRVSRGS